ncbi:MAG: hypothetical protein EBX41_01435 [Chitinophagia bacterium]|nr:hypothetical protein [Chitinophagia bacterium]
MAVIYTPSIVAIIRSLPFYSAASSYKKHKQHETKNKRNTTLPMRVISYEKPARQTTYYG